MLRLLRYLKGHRLESVFGPFFKLMEACFELAVPVIMARLIDVGIKNADKAYVLKMGGILVALGLLGCICSITAQFFAARASMAFGTALRNDLYKHIATFSNADLDRFGAGTLITRLTADVVQTQSGVNLVLRILLRSPFIVAGAVIAAFTINVKLALIFAVAVPVLALTVYFLMRRLLPLYTKTQKNMDKITVKTRENLTGARVVRAFAAQETERTEFTQAADELYGVQRRSGVMSALLDPLSYSAVNLAAAVLLWFGALSVDLGTITQGQTIALLNYMAQILLALLAMANLIVMITKATASSARINEIFAHKPSLSDGDKMLENVDTIKFSDISYSYPGSSLVAVDGLSFKVKRGMTVGVTGGTGSGKSTLVSLLTRSVDPTEGKVLYNGESLDSFTFSSIRAAVSAIPQRPDLFSGTVRDNLLKRDKNASDAELFEAIKTAQAADFIGENLDRPVAKGGSNLSGGQKQRLTIARALVGHSDVLIFDDSASALDYATDAKLRKAVAALDGKRIVFIISQRVFAVKNADLLLVLDGGHLAGAGKHDELLKTCPVYAELCRSQTDGEEAENE